MSASGPMSPPGPWAAAALFVALVIAMAMLVVVGAFVAGRAAGGRAARAAVLTALALAAWLALTGGVAAAGVFRDFRSLPPRLVIALLPPLITLAVLASSRTVGRLVQGIPAVWLVGAQSFRIVVEIVLWWLVAAGAVPEIMSFTGRNFDVLVGLTAPIVASRCFVSRAWPTRLARWWNVAGIVVLVNTVVHAQLAAPTRFQLFVTTPPNTFIGEMPYIWLPAFLVPLAWALHILSFRQLAGTRQGARR